jgi:hypothetical protein
MDAVWLKPLVVEVDAPKLALCCRFEALEVFAPKAALLVRFAEAFRAPVEFEDELPSLVWLELELAADPVPVVAVVEPLLPVVLALFAPELDGLLNVVLLPEFEVSFAFPVDDEDSAAPAELDEPWFAVELLVFAARVPDAARLSLALTAPLDWWADDDCSCPPTDALCA